MQNKRILLIDNDVNQLFLTKARLQNRSDGLEVEIAVDTSEAIEKVRRHHYDCIVSSVDSEDTPDGLALSTTLNNLHGDIPFFYFDRESSGSRSAGTNANLPSDDLLDKIIDSVYHNVRGKDSDHKINNSLLEVQRTFANPTSIALLLSADGLTVERCSKRAEEFFKPEHFVDSQAFQHIPLALLVAQQDRRRIREFVHRISEGDERSQVFNFIDGEMNQVELVVRGMRATHGGSLINLLLTITEADSE